MILSQSPMAKKYAVAYLNVYQKDITKQDIQALQAVYVFFTKHRNFMQLLCTMSADKSVMLRVFEKLCEYFLLPLSMKNLMQMLLKHKRICFLKDIVQNICCLYNIRNNLLLLEIQTADTLDAESIQGFERFFAQESQKKVQSRVHINDTLIAGVRLQSDFFLWDYSIASRLRALKQKLAIEG